jgi:hypothetical protein
MLPLRLVLQIQLGRPQVCRVVWCSWTSRLVNTLRCSYLPSVSILRCIRHVCSWTADTLALQLAILSRWLWDLSRTRPRILLAAVLRPISHQEYLTLLECVCYNYYAPLLLDFDSFRFLLLFLCSEFSPFLLTCLFIFYVNCRLLFMYINLLLLCYPKFSNGHSPVAHPSKSYRPSTGNLFMRKICLLNHSWKHY